MQVGLYHSCFLDWDLEKTFKWASENGLNAVELHGGPRYKFIDWEKVAAGETKQILGLAEKYNIQIVDIMYGALPFLSPQEEERERARKYIYTLIKAAKQLEVPVVSTFTGRDPLKDIGDNIELMCKIFPPIIEEAEKNGVKLCFENCGMIEFWPPVYNIAVTPVIWEEIFKRLPSSYLGLNIDPSHLIWQGIDYVDAVLQFKDKIFMAQAKDTEMLPHVQRKQGMYTYPHNWWRHRIPGQGDVDWGKFVSALHEIGYEGAITIEHEDPIWSGTEAKVIRGVLLAADHLRQFV